MKKLVRRTLIFLLLFAGIIVSLFVVSSKVIRKKADFHVPGSPALLILGHSQPECAYNDSLIPRCKNLGHSGESYYYTYLKTKKVLNDNPSVRMVFIEFTNNQITKSKDNWIWGKKYVDYRYPLYSPFTNTSDKALLVKKSPKVVLEIQPFCIKQNLNRIIRRDCSYLDEIGGYLPLQVTVPDSVIKLADDALSKPMRKNLHGVSKHNLEYLSKTIAYCQDNNVSVKLIRSPMHKKNDAYLIEDVFDSCRTALFSNVDFLDFSEFPLTDKEFADLDHLNQRGAERYSRWFAKLIHTNALEGTNAQQRIDTEIKALLE